MGLNLNQRHFPLFFPSSSGFSPPFPFFAANGIAASSLPLFRREQRLGGAKLLLLLTLLPYRNVKQTRNGDSAMYFSTWNNFYYSCFLPWRQRCSVAGFASPDHRRRRRRRRREVKGNPLIRRQNKKVSLPPLGGSGRREAAFPKNNHEV